MNTSKLALFLTLTILMSSCANSQKKEKSKLIGGPCEGCEAVFEYGNKTLTAIDTLPGFKDSETKLKVTGTIYQKDGKTPAKDVILYIYHTNQKGIYATKGNETGWGKRHGYIRGWVKTDAYGKYTFYTLKPGSYPSSSIPAHIHPTILEPNGNYYWLNDYHFEDDPFLKEKDKHQKSPRGGSSGILTLKKEGDLWVGTRDIVLGKNIPGHH